MLGIRTHRLLGIDLFIQLLLPYRELFRLLLHTLDGRHRTRSLRFVGAYSLHPRTVTLSSLDALDALRSLLFAEACRRRGRGLLALCEASHGGRTRSADGLNPCDRR